MSERSKYILLKKVRIHEDDENKPVEVPRGEILEKVRSDSDIWSGNVDLHDARRKVKLTCPTKEVARLTDLDVNDLMRIRSLEQRLAEFQARNRFVETPRIGNEVFVAVKGRDFKGIVRAVSMMDDKVSLFGVQLFEKVVLEEDCTQDGTFKTCVLDVLFNLPNGGIGVSVSLDKLRPRFERKETLPKYHARAGRETVKVGRILEIDGILNWIGLSSYQKSIEQKLNESEKELARKEQICRELELKSKELERQLSCSQKAKEEAEKRLQRCGEKTEEPETALPMAPLEQYENVELESNKLRQQIACEQKAKEEAEKQEAKEEAKKQEAKEEAKKQEAKEAVEQEAKEEAGKQEAKEEAEKQEGKEEAEKQEAKEEAKKQEAKEEAEKQEAKEEAEKQEAKEEAEKQEAKEEAEKQEAKEEPEKQEAKEEAEKQEAKEEPEKQEAKEEPKKQEAKEEPEKQEAKEVPEKQEAKEEAGKQEAKEEPEKQEAKEETEKQEAKEEAEKQEAKEEAEKQAAKEEAEKQEAKEEAEKQEAKGEAEKQESKDEPEKQKAKEETEKRLQICQEKLKELEATLATAQKLLKGKQENENECEWILNRKEIRLTETELGRGTFGTVYKGIFRGTEVAVKKVSVKPRITEYNIANFRREMKMASKCRHPCMLQFIGATSDDQCPLLVTELLDTSVKAILIERGLDLVEIKTIALDVAKGLNYLHLNHPHPIVHRDISSGNVLLWKHGQSWRGKISDYGNCVLMIYAKTGSGGALSYLAPEMNNHRFSTKSDVYSYGVLLLEMCLRKEPSCSDNIDELICKVEDGGLRKLIRSCLEHDPKQRPSMEKVLAVLTSASQLKATIK